MVLAFLALIACELVGEFVRGLQPDRSRPCHRNVSARRGAGLQKKIGPMRRPFLTR